MAEIHETHVERRRSHAGLFVVTFLVAALLGATVVVVLMNIQGSLYWPAGQVTFNIRPATPPPPPATTATSTTLESTDIAPAAAPTQNVPATDINPAPDSTAATDGTLPAATQPEQSETPQDDPQPQ